MKERRQEKVVQEGERANVLGVRSNGAGHYEWPPDVTEPQRLQQSARHSHAAKTQAGVC